MKNFHLGGVKLSLGETEDQLAGKVSSALDINPDEIKSLEIVRKSIDARRNRPPQFVYVLRVALSQDSKHSHVHDKNIHLLEIEPKTPFPNVSTITPPPLPVVIIGSGPAGLFAAYILAARGVPSIIVERGKAVDRRIIDVENFWHKGILDLQSNVYFGEGGAGTFSDGKLTHRSKNPYSSWVKKIMIEMGAPPEIATDTKPHIGTDKLREVLIHLRRKLTAMGCRFEFNAQVTDFVINHKTITGVVVNEKEKVKTRNVILAIGQNADDTYRKLHECGIKVQAKPFAMGLRIEHRQELINAMQYGKWYDHPQLPPAEYFVKAALKDVDRSIYTFCMCPGGAVIACTSSPGSLITNGMSHYRRSGKFANSAVVVNVRVDDFCVSGHPLDGLTFRQLWEQKAFLAGGGHYRAPAQKTTDFMLGRKSSLLGETSFLPGTETVALNEVIPDFVARSLRQGLREFNKKMFGFVTEESHLIGVETRTSSPVRICRENDGQSSNVRGIYPCGEGAGYAGGIISSALDGIKAAQHLIEHLARPE